jgi:hypothetical protein
MEDLVFAKYDVTCHTVNCFNKDIKIEVEALSVDPFVRCGVCDQQITDVVEVTEEA